MQRTDCYQTLQGSAKKLVSATGLLGSDVLKLVKLVHAVAQG